MKTLLIIGCTFPEPATTAAGSRMLQIISLFSEDGYDVTFASTASASERSVDLISLGISTETILLNDVSFDEFLQKLKPTIVIFDRFITEEQFGWRVSENIPDALRILDTEDLHFLRKAREEAVKNGVSLNEANLYTDTTKREIASILRCDLSLIISEVEIELLQNTFSISPEILYYLPFLVENDAKSTKSVSNFEKRTDFITIGNFLHQPNLDAVIWLKKEIWPGIRSKLPKAIINIYGAYAPQQILEFHNEREGFLIKGWVENASEVLRSSRVCVAPLRFGAGLKGKLLDAMINGTPSVTTQIGAEGLSGKYTYPGLIANTADAFINASVEMYSNKKRWDEAQQNGFRIVQERFQKELFSEAFIKKVNLLFQTLKKHRETNFYGQILQHKSLQSTKYLSKWIEEKNKS